jgi:hypothetical protein
VNEEAERDDEKERRERAEACRHEKANATRPDRDHDEHHLDALEHGDLERRREGHLVETVVDDAEAAQLLGLLREGLGFVMQGDDAGRPQYGFAQPAHAEKEQQAADDELHAFERDARQRRAEHRDDHEKREKRRAAAAERVAPAAHRPDREDDRQGLDELDERSEKRGEHRRPGVKPIDDHRGPPLAFVSLQRRVAILARRSESISTPSKLALESSD